MFKKQSSLLDLVDLKNPLACKVKLYGEECAITSFLRKENKLFVMLQGGQLVAIDEQQYIQLSEILDTHLRKHIFKK